MSPDGLTLYVADANGNHRIREIVIAHELAGDRNDIRVVLDDDLDAIVALAGSDGVAAGASGEVEPAAEAGEVKTLRQSMRERDGGVVARGRVSLLISRI